MKDDEVKRPEDPFTQITKEAEIQPYPIQREGNKLVCTACGERMWMGVFPGYRPIVWSFQSEDGTTTLKCICGNVSSIEGPPKQFLLLLKIGEKILFTNVTKIIGVLLTQNF